MSEVNKVLKVDVISVSSDVIVNKKVKLVLDPVLKDKGQDSCSQLQEEDNSQEHWELQQEGEERTYTGLGFFHEELSTILNN